MSSLGEARMLGDLARRLTAQLESKLLTDVERAQLEHQLHWAATEAELCYDTARCDEIDRYEPDDE